MTMTRQPPLVVAAHGTRQAEGLASCRALVDRVAAKLPGVHVGIGFVELAEPDIATAVADALEAVQPEAGEGQDAVVAPLLLHTGGHVRSDIPEAIEEGRGDAHVAYAGPLMPDPRMRFALQRRIGEALAPDGGAEWRPGDTSVVLVGRGALVPDANAEHYRLSRLVWDEMGLRQVLPAFIQVNRPSVPDALSAAAAAGATQVVVAPVFLFTGKLSQWLAEQVGAWQASHPDVEVRIGGVIGDCDEVADVLIDRYRQQLGIEGAGQGAPVYLSGLRLQGRRALVVGAGQVAERRIPALLEAGAEVRVVAPSAGIKVSGMAARGEVELIERAFRPSDVDGAWYVVAATNDTAVNQQVAETAEAQHVFCVRSDRALGGSAYTPATEQAGGITVAVVGDRNPRRSVKVREELLRALQGV
ncbi:cobalamin biosynthesis protein [Propionibacterium australiense]|uniref:precorrin-2 dehydrogenase n=2 Tax=Propionibacterium australiense TaxID=119981 RepID=A0A8B3GGH4_9ACTN|nr:CbiX/SirB N-terminal domain-containing protein [Propionibacterium australiense]RLP07009.1 cobalamin biosynthesis protein [Propionibacterium australiense]RLP10820.1 cobalamin biosynthesis protein [Propionibacterium australiense]